MIHDAQLALPSGTVPHVNITSTFCPSTTPLILLVSLSVLKVSGSTAPSASDVPQTARVALVHQNGNALLATLTSILKKVVVFISAQQ